MAFKTQVEPAGRSTVGSTVIVAVPDPLSVNVLGVPAGHSRLNEPAETMTGSLKWTVMFVLTATWVAPSAGEVVVTLGALSAADAVE